jgi:hypothetical protein
LLPTSPSLPTSCVGDELVGAELDPVLTSVGVVLVVVVVPSVSLVLPPLVCPAPVPELPDIADVEPGPAPSVLVTGGPSLRHAAVRPKRTRADLRIITT